MNYYNEIKKELIDNEVYKRIKDYSKNKYELGRYYNVGKLLVEAQGGEERAKYGDGLIKEYSKRLILEVGKKYNYKTLLKIRKFYLFSKKVATMSRELTWSHYVELLKFDDEKIIDYYIHQVNINNYTKRQLYDAIKSNEYERLDENTKLKIMKKEESNIVDFVKNPVLIRSSGNYEIISEKILNYEIISEKILKKLILEDIEFFMKELGNGFSYIENEYKIKIGDRYNYIDIILFNIEFNCFVVVELKVTELKKEHIGQIQVYMNYIDRNVKKIDHDKTVGIIIAKKDNKFVMEYCSSNKILRTTYELV